MNALKRIADDISEFDETKRQLLKVPIADIASLAAVLRNTITEEKANELDWMEAATEQAIYLLWNAAEFKSHLVGEI